MLITHSLPMKTPINKALRGKHRCFASSLAAFGLSISIALSHHLAATAITWNSAANGDWLTASNWSSTPALPGISDDVTIAAGTSTDEAYTVTFDASTPANIHSLVLGNASAARAILAIASNTTLTIDRGATTAATLSMINSDLTLASGASIYLRSGDSSNTSQGLVLSGNATATINGSLYTQLPEGAAGSVGAGLNMSGTSGQSNTLTVNSGGVVNFGYTFVGKSGNNASNHVTVDGGSMTVRALEIGQSGSTVTNAYNNSLTIKNGGSLVTGTIGIGGASGNASNGELRLESGSVTISNTLTLGTFGGSTSSTWTNSGTGLVTVKSGTFTVNGANIIIGGGGNDFAQNQTKGIINVEGGTFTVNTSDTTARNFILSNTSYGTGIISVSGNGNMNLASNSGNNTLNLASTDNRGAGSGTATLNISGNGTLNVDILKATTAASTINFDGGLFTVKKTTVSNGKVFTVGNGSDSATFRLLTGTGSGNHTFSDGLVISAKARLEGSGKIAEGIVSVSGTLVASGTLEFADGLELFDGSTIDLNNTSGAILISGGSLTIADSATINISLNSFTGSDPITLFSISGSATSTDLTNVNFLLNGTTTIGAWDGNTFQINASVIPEPASIITLLATSGLAFAILRRRHS